MTCGRMLAGPTTAEDFSELEEQELEEAADRDDTQLPIQLRCKLDILNKSEICPLCILPALHLQDHGGASCAGWHTGPHASNLPAQALLASVWSCVVVPFVVQTIQDLA